MSKQTVEFWSDSRMPYVETRRACQSRICYKAHSHPTFSIGAVDGGYSRFSSYLAKDDNIEAGSLVCIPAYVEHSCNPLPDQTWSYQMMHLNPDWVRQLLMEAMHDCITKKIPELKPRIIKNSQLYQSFCHINTTLFSTDKTIFEKEQVLVENLTQIIFPSLQLEKLEQSRYLKSCLNDLIEMLQQQNGFVSLEQLSSHVGVSRYAIIRLFKNHLGLTPHAFQLNLRINQSRDLLKKGKPLADIAYDLGFTDQSHFHRVFKSLTGVTPKQYQQAFHAQFYTRA